jgi:hypothetical protein
MESGAESFRAICSIKMAERTTKQIEQHPVLAGSQNKAQLLLIVIALFGVLYSRGSPSSQHYIVL